MKISLNSSEKGIDCRCWHRLVGLDINLAVIIRWVSLFNENILQYWTGDSGSQAVSYQYQISVPRMPVCMLDTVFEVSGPAVSLVLVLFLPVVPFTGGPLAWSSYIRPTFMRYPYI